MDERLRTVTVFLGTSEELAVDQELLGDFFAELNNLALGHGVYFRLVKWQWDGRNPPREYDELVRESALCVFLFFTSGGAEMERRFEGALAAFRAHGAPKIVTWFKRVPKGTNVTQELEGFKTRLDRQLHHFYNTYEKIDSVKLGLLLQLVRDVVPPSDGSDALGVVLPKVPSGGLSAAMTAMGLDAVPEGAGDESSGALRMQGDELLLWGRPIMSVRDVPAYAGWESVHAGRRELSALEPRYQAAKARFLANPHDRELREAYLAALRRREKLEKSVELAQRQFLAFMDAMSRQTADASERLTERQVLAYRFVEQGDIETAIAMLDEREILRDRNRAERDLIAFETQRESARARLRAHISEQLQLARLLGSQRDGEARARVDAILADAAACERRHELGYEAQMAYAAHLTGELRIEEAIEQAKGALAGIEPLLRDCDDKTAADYCLLVDLLVTFFVAEGDASATPENAARVRELVDREIGFLQGERPSWTVALAGATRHRGMLADDLLTAWQYFDQALRLLPEGGSAAPDALRKRAQIMEAMGMRAFQVEEWQIAGTAYEDASRVWRLVADLEPSDGGDSLSAVYSAVLSAGAYSELPDCQDKARALLEWSIGSCRQLADGGSLLAKLALAMCLILWVLRDLGDSSDDAVLDAINETEQLLKELAGENPDLFEKLYAGGLCAFGKRLRAMGRTVDALRRLAQSVDLYSELVVTNPQLKEGYLDAAYSVVVAASEVGADKIVLKCAGDYLRMSGEPAEGVMEEDERRYVRVLLILGETAMGEGQLPLARSSFARAVRLARAAADSASVAQAMRDEAVNMLFYALWRLGTLDCEQGRLHEAVEELSEAADLGDRCIEKGPRINLDLYVACLDELAAAHERSQNWWGVSKTSARIVRAFKLPGVTMDREYLEGVKEIRRVAFMKALLRIKE